MKLPSCVNLEADMKHRNISSQLVKMVAAGSVIAASAITNTFALEADKNQELLLSSEGGTRMSIVDGIRFVEMSDNVVITRGTMEIRGDTATIEIVISNEEVRKVTVVGSPVLYEQQLDSSDEPVKGSSNTVTFYPDENDGTNVVELIGEAVIESPTSSFKCRSIVYIAELDLIRETEGPCSGAFSSSN